MKTEIYWWSILSNVENSRKILLADPELINNKNYFYIHQLLQNIKLISYNFIVKNQA